MDSRKFLTPDEREHLERFLKDRLESDLRNATMILTALYSGARANELLSIQWSDVDLSTGEIVLRTLKRRKRKPGETGAESEKKSRAASRAQSRPIVVPRFLRVALSKLKHESPSEPFNIKYSRLAEIWSLYRPSSEKPFKSLRHSFAIRAYQKTKDIRFVQKILGHKNIQNTMIYLDYCYSAQEFKRMMSIR